jgi:3-oxoacyl-[acyl-carrier protein] reductase
MSSLKDKVAIVTGASRGIGRSIAERLAQEGAAVVVNYCKSADKAQEVVRGIEEKGGHALAVQADVSKVSDIQRLFQQIIGHYERALNTKSVFFTLQEAGRHIADGGRIIYISTSATASSYPGSAVYKGTKAAGEHFITTLAHELGPRQVTVNTVSPGFTETDMLPKDEALRETGMHMSPLRRLGQPIDIAHVVAFLVSEEGGWITGDNIQASGGIT